MSYSLERGADGSWTQYQFPYKDYDEVVILMKENDCGLYGPVPCWNGMI